MSQYWIELFAKALASATVSLLVTLPLTFGLLWFARRLDVFSQVGWPNPTNEQMFLIALFVAFVSR